MTKIHKRIWYNIATLFCLGNIKYAHGTAGSFVGIIVAWPLHRYIYAYTVFFIISFFAGVYSSDITQEQIGRKDPKNIIIDEFSSIFATFLLIPGDSLSFPIIITGFAIYRILDIFKIPPINLLEKIKGGWGIMLDDLACGIISGLLLRLLISLKIFI